MRQTITFLNRFYRPDSCATAQILGSLCDRLAADPRLTLRVVCGRCGYLEPAANRPPLESMGGVEVIRLWSSAFGRESPLGRLIDYASLHLSMALYLLRRVKAGDIVVVATDPPLLGVTVAWVRMLRPFTVVSWCQDVFPEVAMASLEREIGLDRSNSRVRGAARAVARTLLRGLLPWRDWSLRQSRAVVAISPRMAEALQARGLGLTQVRVIENWPVQAEADEAMVERLRRGWRLAPKRLVVGHFGNLGRGHDYRTVWRAIEATVERPIQWLFVGGGHGLEALRERLSPAASAQVRMAPYLPLEELGSGLTVPDLHWLSLRQVMEPHLFPSKFYGILKAGKPLLLIGSPDSDLGRLIREHAIGCVVAEGDSDSLASELGRLIDDPAALQAMGRRARAVYEERYKGGRQQEAWDALLQSVEVPLT